jgi:hypothetical protein
LRKITAPSNLPKKSLIPYISSPTMSSPLDDPFDNLLTLEDTLYTTAYDLGTAAGSRAGRIEGRIFGLENGFEKFRALGSLHGRSQVWGSRVLPSHLYKSTAIEDWETVEEETREKTLPNFPENGRARLQNNITLLHSLTDPDTFSTENTEDAVADFDDRVKRAGAKAKVIERIVGEGDVASTKSPDDSPARGKGRSVRVEGAKKGDDNIEDFAGSRLLR